MATVLTQTENKHDVPKSSEKKPHRSMRVRWKIYCCFMGVAAAMLVVLWLCQTVFFSAFYYSVKKNELKKAANYVCDNLDSDNLQTAMSYLAGNGQMSLRVIDTDAFSSEYESGEDYGPVMYGIGIYELYGIYSEALDNSGECSRFYIGKNDRSFMAFIKPGERPENAPDSGDGTDNTDAETDTGDESKSKYKRSHAPALFFNNDVHNDLLYAKIKTMSDGSEKMVVAETRVTPLDSTVSTLRYQNMAVTVFVTVLSLITSFLVAKFISKPIEKINSSAKELASGKYDTHFDGRGYSEIEQLNDTLNYTASELGKVETLRRELMANVSHDMRTPLTMIIGYSEAMRDLPGENTPENVQVIIDEARRLTEFVNNILDLTKLQNGIEKLEPENLNFTEMLEKLVARYKMLYLNNGYKVLLEYDRKAYCVCDAMKMSQVILNLIDNAVNYTGEDKTVKVIQTVKDGKIRVEVRDSGEGIPENELPYIWDRYYKSDKNHKRNVVGSGIGLSIVKEILTKHSACFGVESTLHEGSTFWFELDEAKQP